MPWSHVRCRFWDSERYTDAQALEFRQMRALYTTHLVPVFGPALPDAFALRTEGNDYYPRYTANTLASPAITEVPPSETQSAGPFFSIAHTLVETLNFYEVGRRQRLTGKGHPNDPTRLLGIFIRTTAQRFLAYAPATEVTLRQVKALRQYLEALGRLKVFTAEGDDHDSMTFLLHNLATPLQLLEKRLQHHISLHSAREHFEEMKNAVSHTLSEAATYLFCVPAAQDRTPLPFSLTNMQARVVNRELTQALNTREGLLLKQWMHAPGVVHTLFPQADAKETNGLLMQKPVPLLTTQSTTPLLDEKGQPHSAWLGFLGKDTAHLELDPSVRCEPRRAEGDGEQSAEAPIFCRAEWRKAEGL